MLVLQAYLASPKVRRTLRTKPGQKGFSLIELVVVIAILGILIAIALPAFINVQRDAKINQAKTVLAQLVKECSVSDARELGSTLAQTTSDDGNLGDYTIAKPTITAWNTTAGAGTTVAVAAADSCYSMAAIPGAAASAKTTWKLPGFAIEVNPTTGAVNKFCIKGTDPAAYNPASLCDDTQNASTPATAW